ncbi:MAG: hydroxyacid dehydrogenase [Planctomycetaceae bacterium]|nr:hydroxyacid dehydrogenase [Planctomycetaceae bacterium]
MVTAADIKRFALLSYSTSDVADWITGWFDDRDLQFVVNQCTTEDQAIETAKGAQVIWIHGSGRCLTENALAAMPDVVAIIRSGSGTNDVPVDAATQSGIIVCNTPWATAQAVSDLTVGFIIIADRRIAWHDRRMRENKWTEMDNLPIGAIPGKTVGLVGFGYIAKAVAKKLSGFDVNLLATDPLVDADEMAKLNVTKCELDHLLTESDFVSLHCPLNDHTFHLINADALARMKPTAKLINTCRGPVVDEPALIHALRNGVIAEAVLDVYETEPPAPDNPLLKMENVTLTPHLGSHVQDFLYHFQRASLEIADDLIHGRWPQSVVNRAHVKPIVAWK